MKCVEETTGRRSNAGMNAMREAIRHGATKLFCLGFDFVMTDEKKNTDNIYKGSEGYGEETHATYEDSKHRVNYLNWFETIQKMLGLHLLCLMALSCLI